MTSMSEGVIGVAEAKRRFSELLDRVAAGERIVIERRGKPAVVLVRPEEAPMPSPRPAPKGFASLAGAFSDWPEFGEVMDEVYASRRDAGQKPDPFGDYQPDE